MTSTNGAASDDDKGAMPEENHHHVEKYTFEQLCDCISKAGLRERWPRAIACRKFVANRKNLTFLLVRDLQSLGAKIKQLGPSNAHFAFMLEDARPVQFLCDIDRHKVMASKHVPDILLRSSGDAIPDAVRRLLVSFNDDLGLRNREAIRNLLESSDFIVYSCHNNDKDSFHCHCPALVFNNREQLRAYVRQWTKWIERKYDETEQIAELYGQYRLHAENGCAPDENPIDIAAHAEMIDFAGAVRTLYNKCDGQAIDVAIYNHCSSLRTPFSSKCGGSPLLPWKPPSLPVSEAKVEASVSHHDADSSSILRELLNAYPHPTTIATTGILGPADEDRRRVRFQTLELPARLHSAAPASTSKRKLDAAINFTSDEPCAKKRTKSSNDVSDNVSSDDVAASGVVGLDANLGVREGESNNDAAHGAAADSVDTITEIVGKLSDQRATRRDSWSHVIFALQHTARAKGFDLRPLAHAFSRRTRESNYDPVAVDALYDRNPSDYKGSLFTFRTLRHWAETDARERQRVQSQSQSQSQPGPRQQQPSNTTIIRAPPPNNAAYVPCAVRLGVYSDYWNLRNASANPTIDDIKQWMCSCLLMIANNGKYEWYVRVETGDGSREQYSWIRSDTRPFSTTMEDHSITVPDPDKEGKTKSLNFSTILKNLCDEPMFFRRCIYARLYYRPLPPTFPANRGGENDDEENGDGDGDDTNDGGDDGNDTNDGDANGEDDVPAIAPGIRPAALLAGNRDGSVPTFGQALNTFPGWSVAPRLARSDADRAKLGEVLAAFRDIIANGNPEYFEYLLNWLAHAVQRPHKKIGTALVLCGPPGAGKNLMIDFVAQKIFGNELHVTLTSMDQLTQQFNALQENKLLFILNEVKAQSFAHADKIKSLITDKYQTIEPKHKEQKVALNPSNHIIMSNHDFVVRIEIGDRRYACIHVTDPRSSRYYRRLARQVLKREVAELLLGMLMQRDISDWDPKAIPETRLRIDNTIRALSAPLRFCIAIAKSDVAEISGAAKIDLVEYPGDPEIRCRFRDFYSAFLLWKIGGNHHFASNEDQFWMELKCLPCMNKTKVRIGGGSFGGVKFRRNELREVLQKRLKLTDSGWQEATPQHFYDEETPAEQDEEKKSN